MFKHILELFFKLISRPLSALSWNPTLCRTEKLRAGCFSIRPTDCKRQIFCRYKQQQQKRKLHLKPRWRHSTSPIELQQPAWMVHHRYLHCFQADQWIAKSLSSLWACQKSTLHYSFIVSVVFTCVSLRPHMTLNGHSTLLTSLPALTNQ